MCGAYSVPSTDGEGFRLTHTRTLTHLLTRSLSHSLSRPPVVPARRSQAPPGTVFGGSPQVMGVVKLCTGLAVTSLPLYFDIRLLRRSEDVSAHL